MRHAKCLFAVAAILVAADTRAPAQNLSPDDAFSWSATGPEEILQPGGSAEIIVMLSIAPGHYVYRDSVSVSAQPPAGVLASPAIYPEPKVKFDRFENTEVAIYEGTVRVRLPVRMTADAPSGEVPVALVAKHRGCSQEVCYFPATRNLTVSLKTTGGQGTAFPAGFIPIEKAPVQQSDLFSQGLLRAFLLVFIGGFLTSLTPCVYPLIPVTVGIFGARGVRRLEAFTLSLIYVAGICLMYAILGLVAAGTGAVFGSVMANPVVVSGVVFLLGLLGLSMLGAFEIRIPSALQAVLSSAGGKGYAGAFGMGLVAGIIAAPCTGPVLAGVLVFVATTGNLFLGFWLLFVFALGLGVLFLVIGTFSGAIAYLPRSGPWMDTIRSLFGIVLLAMALYFAKLAYPWLGKILFPLPVGLIIGVALILISLPLGWAHRATRDGSSVRRVLRHVGVALAVLGAYLCVGAFTVPQKGPIDWIYSEEAGLRQAQTQGKPVIIDLWADWCVACKELDATTFRDPRVARRLKDFVTIKLDFTRDSPERTRLTKKYNVPGLPILQFYSAEGKFLSDAQLVGYQNADALLEHLDSLGL
jgi:thiol:disulfide interchange protein DsbD